MITPLEPEDPRGAGEFRLRARLGTGGMGQVYLGYSPGGRAVAVKICHPEFAGDESFRRRFALEVAAARSVSGMFTAQVVGAGPDDDPPWLATVYVPGPSLYDTVQAFGPLPHQATWRLAAGLAEALRDIHARGLVHRDLKPTNVLLATDGPRVIDFGVARAAEQTAMTTTGMAFGTPAYMSPEQAEGREAGPASDVFSLGCVLCYAATRTTPFGDGPPPTLLYRVVHTQPELRAVPAPMRPLITACLDKDPARRPTLPQILRACQEAGVTEVATITQVVNGASGAGVTKVTELAGGAGGAISAAVPVPGFWPSDVASVIARYQASLDSATRSLPDPGDPTAPVSAGRAAPAGTVPAGTVPVTRPATKRAGTWLGRTGLGASGQGVQGVLRRRGVLAGLGGLAAAGLAAGAWEWSRSGNQQAQNPRATGHRPGQVVWSYRTGGQVTSGAVISGGVVYIGSHDRKVYGFDAATGRLTTTFTLGGAVQAGLAQAGGTVYAGSADHKVYALGGGHPWTAQTEAAVNGTPAVSGGVVYIGSDDHYVYALDALTGNRNWRYLTGGAVRSRPLPGTYPYNQYVYAGSDDGYLYALGSGAESFEGPKAGHLGWRFGTGGAVDSGPVFDGLASVYVGTNDGRLYDLSADGTASGGQLTSWHFTAAGAVVTDPVKAADAVYLGSAGGYVYAIDSSLGTLIWNYRTRSPVRSGIAISGTVLYAGCEDGYLYAIDITSQTLRWKFRAGGAIRSRILVADGLVYFGSLDHVFYAVKAA